MKLTKAQEILKLNIVAGEKKMPPDVMDALKLGVEAQKEVTYLRSGDRTLVSPLLPGETPDGESP